MEQPLKESLIVICGATATGKSGLALELAQRLDTIIISADSRQVYRELDIGTAKPSLAERQLVPHYLIDICEPTETLTLAQYQQQVQSLIDFSFSSKQENNVANSVVPPLLVGGTGLYIQSIVKGLKIPSVSPQPALRKQLKSLGQKQLYDFLCQVDCRAAAKIHANDQVRTLRALEVFYVTGKPISEQQGEVPPAYPIRQIGLDCDSEILKKRIELRTEKMIKLGLVEEVSYLGEKYGWDLPLLNTLGYREIKEHLINNLSLDVAREMIVLHTCQFAKRQRTWFRAISDIVWFDINSPNLIEQVWKYIQDLTSPPNPLSYKERGNYTDKC